MGENFFTSELSGVSWISNTRLRDARKKRNIIQQEWRELNQMIIPESGRKTEILFITFQYILFMITKMNFLVFFFVLLMAFLAHTALSSIIKN